MAVAEPEPDQGPQREIQVYSLGGPDWTGSEQQACLCSVQHCSFAVVAAAVDLVGAVSTAGLDQAQGPVAAGCYLSPSAGVS